MVSGRLVRSRVPEGGQAEDHGECASEQGREDDRGHDFHGGLRSGGQHRLYRVMTGG